MKAKKLLTISRKSKQEEKEEIEKSQYRLEVLKKNRTIRKRGKI